jgi:hypothetical protein
MKECEAVIFSLYCLWDDFVPQHNNDYACVTKSLQLRVSLRFAAPRYDAYCKIWVK